MTTALRIRVEKNIVRRFAPPGWIGAGAVPSCGHSEDSMAQNVARLRQTAEKPLTKTEQFRQMLLSPRLEFIMEAHNGLSAKIVEETGFKGIWASGLTI